MKLSTIANLATCISLIIYILGNIILGIITVINAKKNNNDIFIWNPEDNILKNYFVIYKAEDYKNKIVNFQDRLLISTYNTVFNMKIYYIKYDEQKNKFIKDESIFFIKRLLNKECILFDALISEGIPRIAIQWETISYMKGYLKISYNGITGNVYEKIMYKHTFKSFIYYMFNHK